MKRATVAGYLGTRTMTRVVFIFLGAIFVLSAEEKAEDLQRLEEGYFIAGTQKDIIIGLWNQRTKDYKANLQRDDCFFLAYTSEHTGIVALLATRTEANSSVYIVSPNGNDIKIEKSKITWEQILDWRREVQGSPDSESMGVDGRTMLLLYSNIEGTSAEFTVFAFEQKRGLSLVKFLDNCRNTE